MVCCKLLVLLLLTELTSSSSPKMEPTSLHLRVSSNEGPLVVLNGTKVASSYNSIISYSVFKLLVERLQFTYEVIPPSDMQYGNFANGKWTGMVGQIYRKEIELGAQAITADYVRSQAADGTYPIIFDTSSILIPSPTEGDTLLAPLLPFSVEVWALLLLSFILVTLLSAYTTHHQDDISGCGLATLSLFTGQSFYYISSIRNLPSRWVMAGCSLAAVIIINAYTTVLFSLLTIPKYKPVISSVEDLATSSIMPSVAKGTSYDIIFMNASSGIYKIIGDRIRQNPQLRLDKISDAPDLVADGKLAFILSTRYIQSMVMDDYTKNSKCRLMKAAKNFYPITLGFLLPKKNPLRSAVNREILLMHEHGLMNYFQHRIKLESPCKQIGLADPKIQPLQLRKFSSLFILLGLGTGFSVLVFIGETVTASKLRASPIRVLEAAQNK